MRSSQQIADAITAQLVECMRYINAPDFDPAHAALLMNVYATLTWAAGCAPHSGPSETTHACLDEIAAKGARLRQAVENFKEN